MSMGTRAVAADRSARRVPRGTAPWRYLVAAVFVGWWVGFGVMYSVRDWLWTSMRGQPVESWLSLVASGQGQALSEALLALVAFAAVRRFPLERRGWPVTLAGHAGIAVVAIAANALVFYGLSVLLGQPHRYEMILIGVFPGWALIYTMMLGVAYGIAFFRRYEEAELRRSELSTQLARAQLQALKMQLHPHFLFNTLNSISALMHQDLRAADRMLSRLEDLLRLTLEKAGTHEVRLEEELTILGAYLEIEQTRFGPRLSVDWDVETDTLDASVPHLILQPLVENAIKYAISPRSTPGRIRVSARRVEGRLELEVLDNGPGVPGALLAEAQAAADASRRIRLRGAERGGGVGLANTRARLQQLYPGVHEFAIRNVPEGGARVRIVLPLRYAESARLAA